MKIWRSLDVDQEGLKDIKRYDTHNNRFLAGCLWSASEGRFLVQEATVFDIFASPENLKEAS